MTFRITSVKLGTRTLRLSLAIIGLTTCAPSIKRLEYSTASSPASDRSSSSSPHDFSDSESLTTNGVSIGRNFLSHNQIDNIKKSLASEIEKKIVFANEISKGRYHYNMLPSSAFANLEEIKHLISEIVIPATSIIGMNPQDLMLTTLQIVDSVPGSAIQIWHADNAEKGLTVIIPLTDLTENNGPTELIIGSHDLLHSIQNGKIALVRPIISAGDGIVMDGRVLHRGGANSSNSSRPILVLRYDSKKTQPPCMTTVGATLRLFLAKSIVAFWGDTQDIDGKDR